MTAVNWVMEMQSGRTHPQGAWSTGGGAVAIIQGVIYSDRGKCCLLLWEMEERQLCVWMCVCAHVRVCAHVPARKLMIGSAETEGCEGVRQVKGAG